MIEEDDTVVIMREKIKILPYLSQKYLLALIFYTYFKLYKKDSSYIIYIFKRKGININIFKNNIRNYFCIFFKICIKI